ARGVDPGVLDDEIDRTLGVVALRAHDEPGDQRCRDDGDDKIGREARGHAASVARRIAPRRLGGILAREARVERAARATACYSLGVISGTRATGDAALVRAIGLGSATFFVVG